MAAQVLTDPPAHPRFQLAPAFGLLGLVGGALVGAIGWVRAWMLPVALVTGITCAALGAWLTRLQRTQPHKATLPTFVGGTLLSGAISGALCLVPIAFPFGSILGFFLGTIFALPFVPALGFVFAASGNVGRARLGTHADRADRSGVLSALAVVLATCSYLSLLPTDRASQLALASCALLGFVLAVVACARTVHAYWAARRAADRVGQAALFDFGVGADLLADTETEHYRGQLPPRRHTLGDPTLAMAHLRDALQRDVATLIATTVITAVQAVHVLPR